MSMHIEGERDRECDLTIFVVLKLCWFVGSAHFVEHHAEGPHVNLRPNGRVVLADFWRDVPTSSTAVHHLRLACLVHYVTQSKVTDLDNG